MLRWHRGSLVSHPFLTQGVTTTVLFAIGDVMAQQVIEKRGPTYDFGRICRMALYGTALWCPAVSKWFKFLQNNISLKTKNLEIITRVAIDQTLFAPTSIFMFFTCMSAMEGSNPQEKLNKSYFSALKRNWMVWLFVQFINFRFVPLETRVILVSVILLGWNCYLSYTNNSGCIIDWAALY
ncbi:hypothetical protein QBC38DRAFT_463458 [Podospora fimiseda]|uniref:Uncharacterized protein n=1 Tax=Podospora fimiseda TaxID=252190 RepID=A0AAN7H8L7_9PEZI|nr:hypothetical protein QBC38DRAFT_463458 [Podospora fimiseda]